MEKEMVIVSGVSQDYSDVDLGLLLLIGKSYLEIFDSMTTDAEIENDIPPYDEDEMLRSIWSKIEEESET